jgi:hypothetical protein
MEIEADYAVLEIPTQGHMHRCVVPCFRVDDFLSVGMQWRRGWIRRDSSMYITMVVGVMLSSV